MEPVFSVDDIVGTLWNSGGDLSVGVQSTETTAAGGQHEYNPQGLNRSASEFAFQEFIGRTCPDGSGSNTHRRRAFFSSDDEAENDEDLEPSSREDRSELTEPKPEDTPSGTSAPTVEDPDSSPSNPAETAESLLEEPEIKAALHPLFSGLRSEMTHNSAGCDPEEMNTYYQEKLKEACLRARQSREGKLRLCDPVQAPSGNVGLLKAGGATCGRNGGEALNVGTASGKLGTPTCMPESQDRFPGKPVTSGSSQEQSDDEDCEIEQNLEPGDKKRVKRMLSNRESARRSRRRKQAHLNELESQVAQLRLQNSTLVETLHTTNQKLKDACKDNLQLKTYVEMLKAKLLAASTLQRQLTMASLTVQSRVPFSMAKPELPAVSSYFGWESGPHYAQGTRPSIVFPSLPPLMQAPRHGQALDVEHSGLLPVQQGVKMSRTPSMQRVSSMDHLKKRIRNTGASCSPTAWGAVGGLDLEGPSMVPQFYLSGEY